MLPEYRPLFLFAFVVGCVVTAICKVAMEYTP